MSIRGEPAKYADFKTDNTRWVISTNDNGMRRYLLTDDGDMMLGAFDQANVYDNYNTATDDALTASKLYPLHMFNLDVLR